MKELCIDARMLLASGIGTYLRSLLPFLAQGPFALRLIVNKHLLEQLPWLSRFSLELLEAPVYSVAEQLQLPRIIGLCDLFWSPHYNIPLLRLRARHRLVTIHDINHIVLSKNLRIVQKMYAHLVVRQAVARSTHIITDSEFSKRELCTHVNAPVEKITVIHPGVDKKRFSKEDDGRSVEIKKRYRLPEKYFLFVGNLKPHKNLAGLIRAYQHAGKQLEIPLVVVGRREGFLQSDQESFELIKKFALDQKILFLGFVIDEDLPTLYRLSSGTICPSFYEGFGLPAIEAMSAGSPVAVSRVASLPEVCGEAALYFDPHHPEDIARVLLQLSTHTQLREMLKIEGERQSQQFCWEKCAEAHIRVMEKICRT